MLEVIAATGDLATLKRYLHLNKIKNVSSLLYAAVEAGENEKFECCEYLLKQLPNKVFPTIRDDFVRLMRVAIRHRQYDILKGLITRIYSGAHIPILLDLLSPTNNGFNYDDFAFAFSVIFSTLSKRQLLPLIGEWVVYSLTARDVDTLRLLINVLSRLLPYGRPIVRKKGKFYEIRSRSGTARFAIPTGTPDGDAINCILESYIKGGRQ